MEVLAGARDDRRAHDLRRLMDRFSLMRFDASVDFDGATRIYRTCRRSGVTPRGMVDCMISGGRAARWCQPAGCRLGSRPRRERRGNRDRIGLSADSSCGRSVSRHRDLRRTPWKHPLRPSGAIPETATTPAHRNEHSARIASALRHRPVRSHAGAVVTRCADERTSTLATLSRPTVNPPRSSHTTSTTSSRIHNPYRGARSKGGWSPLPRVAPPARRTLSERRGVRGRPRTSSTRSSGRASTTSCRRSTGPAADTTRSRPPTGPTPATSR